MARTLKPGARKGTPEWRQRVAAGVRRHHERRRAIARIYPSDLVALARPGAEVRPELRPLVDAAASELDALVDALGGPDRIAPQRLAIAQDVARAGLLVRALVARFGVSGDPDLASKIGTLLGQRRQGLQALGLDRFEREVPSLGEYLRQREAAGETGHAAQPAARSTPARSSPESPAPARGAGAVVASAPPSASQEAADEPIADPSDPEAGGEGEDAGVTSEPRRCWCSAPLQADAAVCTGGHPQDREGGS